MTSLSNQQTGVTRTERGLVITGTRITLYQIMDYLHAGHSLQLIREHFAQITNEQLTAAISYIKENSAEVEAEYKIIVKDNELSQQNWEEHNREKLAFIAKLPPPPGKEAAWKKLQIIYDSLDRQYPEISDCNK